MMRSSGMSSHCVVPYWNNNQIGQQRQEQLQVQGDHQEERNNNNVTSCHVQNHTSTTTTPTSTTNVVPLSNYHPQVKELTWENGQIAMHGLLPLGPSKPIWARTGGTLESVVHQATCHTQGPNNNMMWTPATISANIVGSSAGKWAEKPKGEPTAMTELRKRARAEIGRGNKVEEQCGGPSGCASASATFCRDSDTTMVTWASFESPPSFKTKTTDEDSTSHGCLENQDEDCDTKGESGRSNCTRRSRAAAVHNQSERRRRDRINQKMKALQKLVPNASKTDKASMLDEVIEYLKQLQAQVQVMSSVRNMAAVAPSVAPPPHVMMSLGMQQQQQHLQMSLLAARMGMGMGMGMGHSLIHPNPLAVGPTFVPPHFIMPHVVPAQSQAKSAAGTGSSSSAPFPDPYCALLAQSMNIELYNKMAALYGQQVSQATQAVGSPSRSNQVQAD